MTRGRSSGVAPGLLAGGGLVLAAALYLWALGGPGAAGRVGGPFSLVAGDGTIVTPASFSGRWMLIYFGYTGCRDECPVSLATAAAALETLGSKADRIQPVFITVDPAHDTPDAVRRYAAAISPRLIGLSGSRDQITHAMRNYRVTAAQAGTSIDHSSVFYLMDPRGRFVAPIPAGETRDGLARDLARLVR